MPFIQHNHIRIHYLEFPAPGKPLLVLMHGLTANAHAFDGIVNEGLIGQYHIVAVDLRGRGQSDHPAFHYTMHDHAGDILQLLDELGAKTANFVGHSFGGLLSFYIAAHYPERVEKLVILDAAARMNARAPEMLAYRLASLDVRFPRVQDYFDAVRQAPYNTFWSEAMQSYYEADLKDHEEGGVTPRPVLANIIKASMGVAQTPWPKLLPNIHAPVLLIHAPEPYTLDEPLLPEELAAETVHMLPNARMIQVAGNHQTMLYGEGAKQIALAIRTFVD